MNPMLPGRIPWRYPGFPGSRVPYPNEVKKGPYPTRGPRAFASGATVLFLWRDIPVNA